jgi:hypothetical protein
VDPGQRIAGNHVAHDLDRVVMDDADVRELLLVDPPQQRADPGHEDFDAEEIDVGPRCRDRGGRFAHPEAHFEHGRRIASEYCVEAKRGGRVGNSDRRQPTLVRAPLALSDMAAPQCVTPDMSVRRTGY